MHGYIPLEQNMDYGDIAWTLFVLILVSKANSGLLRECCDSNRRNNEILGVTLEILFKTNTAES